MGFECPGWIIIQIYCISLAKRISTGRLVTKPRAFDTGREDPTIQASGRVITTAAVKHPNTNLSYSPKKKAYHFYVTRTRGIGKKRCIKEVQEIWTEPAIYFAIWVNWWKYNTNYMTQIFIIQSNP